MALVIIVKVNITEATLIQDRANVTLLWLFFHILKTEVTGFAINRKEKKRKKYVAMKIIKISVSGWEMMLKNQGYSIAFTSEASASAMLILMMWN
jgi:hypothetical protein